MIWTIKFTSGRGFIDSIYTFEYSDYVLAAQAGPAPTVVQSGLYLINDGETGYYEYQFNDPSSSNFEIFQGDSLILAGQLTLSDGTYVDAGSPNLDIAWYDSNNSYLSSGRVYTVDRESSLSGIYITANYDGTNYGMSSSDAIDISLSPVVVNNLRLYDTEGEYHIDHGVYGGAFHISDGDGLYLGGEWEFANGNMISAHSMVNNPDINITWYDSNGTYLASNTTSYLVDSSISGIYVTVEYDGLNYGMSPSEAISKTGTPAIENSPAQFNGLGITGEFTEGSTLTADYQVTDANGWSGFANVSWYHSDDLNTVVGTGSSYAQHRMLVSRCILKFLYR